MALRMPSKQAQFYRSKAKEMRDLGRRAPDARLKEKLAEVAAEYDRLAQETGD